MNAATEKQQLAELTLSLVNIPSESRDERRLAEHIGHTMEPLGLIERYRTSDYLLYTTERDTTLPLIVVAGHLDTVPAQANRPGAIDGSDVVGLGAADMKGGLSVMIQLAYWIARERPARALDVAFLFFAREELPVAESPLPELFELEPSLTSADLAIVLEPTDNAIQTGCLGNLNATLRFHGEAAHSARPWTGKNAIEVATQQLPALLAREREEIVIDGLSFYEVVSVTQISGGVADNVIPDLVECRVNYRFAPNRTVDAALERVVQLLGEDADVEISSISSGAPVASENVLVRRLESIVGRPLEPKQAWTPVAQFTDAGLPAINFGPGDPIYAHRRDERVAIASLHECLQSLKALVAAPQNRG
ncbi:MAG: succinyl-diaminopimelate desuccinylase [Gaiellaceae bacterium]